MMETSKYYTPGIEEFHVGFEYEVYDMGPDMKNWAWRKQIFEGEETRTYFREELGKGEMRVKLLDREDIEACGWNFKKLDEKYNCDIYFKKSSFIHDESCFYVLSNGLFRITTYDAERQNPIYYGNVRNISELRKLMKMLKIE